MDIEIIRSKRKSIAIQLKEADKITVRAPLRVSDKEIMSFVESKMAWIISNSLKLKMKQEKLDKVRPLSDQEIAELYKSAKVIIGEKVRQYAPIVGVTYGRITIRKQKSRWGSCSAKGNLNFNVALMRAPEKVLDYVVVHELCHRLEMNHSARFYKEVRRVMPDYEQAEKWLKVHGDEIMAEVHGN